MMQMAKDAGVPDGVLNVFHGTHDAVNKVCDHEAIRYHLLGAGLLSISGQILGLVCIS